MSKIFVNIATYNEKENIERLIVAIFALKINDLSVLVIDDNSPDDTAQIVEQLKNRFSNLMLIERESKLGYGSAQIAGFKTALASGAEVIITMDADHSHNPTIIPNLITAIKDGNDVAIGSRKIPGGKIVGWHWWRHFASTGAMLTSQIILGIATNDLTSGFRAYRRQVLEKIDLEKIKSNGYSFLEELIYLIEKIGFKIKEVPITFTDRLFGKSKLSKREILNFFLNIFKIKFSELKKIRFNLENFVYGLLILSFFIGLRHAFPMLKVISDEMYFVGGVLRAMENFTIFPGAGDVPYGLLTYYLNYILIAKFLILSLPFFQFNLESLKSNLIQSPEIIYLIPRVLSAILAIFYLIIFAKIFKKEFSDWKIRIYLVLILFTNMLTVLVLRTGKMWVLSMLLTLLSFYYLYRALNYRDQPESSVLSRSITLSIIFSFLAVTNFIFNAIFLINIPILLIFFWSNQGLRKKIIFSTIFGVLIFVLITLTNLAGIKELLVNQFTYYRPLGENEISAQNLSVFASFIMYLKRLVLFFPVILLTLLLAISQKIKNQKLLMIASAYFLVYFLMISFIGTWSAQIYSYIHYSFPFAFFLVLIISSLDLKFSKIFYFLGLISLVYFIFSLYYLSLPTTYNEAANWILKNLNQKETIIINEIRNLDLPKNKSSYLLTAENYCASICQNVIANDLNKEFLPLVIDKYSKADWPKEVDQKTKENFVITDKLLTASDFELEASLTNPIEIGFSADGKMANYFDFDFFKIKNFGPNIYIYRTL